jgi:hypothetical protein
VDEYGYPTDEAVLEQLVPAIERGAPLIIGHLNDPDTAGHVLGCDTAAAHERYHATDRVVGHVVDALRTGWDDLVLFVVSDHDHEMVTDDPTDLREALAEAGVDAQVHEDGSVAVLLGGGDLGRWIAGRIADQDDRTVQGAVPIDGGWTVWPAAGGWYAPASFTGLIAGMHGSPRTQTQVAVVSGGHPAAGAIAATFADGVRPTGRDWAPTIASLLGVTMPGATGRSLP